MQTHSEMYQLDSLEDYLKYYFGYDHFRPGQRKIIEEAVNGKDLLVIMPTGGGKSLCFQLPALLKHGIMIVISPLIALMQDQVQALQDNGIQATFINSSLTYDEINYREQEILLGKLKLLYVSPERMVSDRFIFFLEQVSKRVGIAGFTIDEAHCISEWGHDFRPEYRQIQHLRYRYPEIPIFAFTATATHRVQEDILNQLKLKNASVHIASFNRTNLYYEVIPKDGKRSYNQLYRKIKEQEGSGIIYCLSRKTVDEIAGLLQKDGIKALPYHAGMDDQQRMINQTRFIRDDVDIMVATIAFGMGINKPDVRFVFHYDLPRNLESYYQESGRAGRDGESSHCAIFYSRSDINKVRYFIEQKENLKEKIVAEKQLQTMIDYVEGTECRRTLQLRYFGEKFKGNCGQCDNCRYPKPIEDWTIESQKFLSCIYRSSQRFGMNHIIDILLGSANKKVLENGHHLLSTYGIGKDRSKDDWKHLGRFLINQGWVTESPDQYHILKLNDASWQILRKQKQVYLAVHKRTDIDNKGHYNPKQAEAEMLFDRLRLLRKKLADKHQVPPYVIFADSSLKLMAQRQPQSLAEFAKISGVGEHKLKQYGDAFVSEIRDFIAQHQLPAVLAKDTHLVTLQYYQQGFTPQGIAQQRNLTLTTIYNHLAELIETNQPINLSDLVPPKKQEKILAIIENIGELTLKPIKDKLPEDYTYEEIRLVRAWWKREQF